jgi:EAL domain-containing protein (putative c-di-GMP-specific phosphodiesterase class I)
VADIGENKDNTAIVAAIVSMAKALELTVVAEGVETESQLEVLTRLECDEAQGYLFSRPISVEKARNLVVGSMRLSNAG